MIPIVYKNLINEFVEVCIVDPFNGRKYWYHGKLLETNIGGIKIEDIKVGELTFDNTKILYVKKMNKDEIEKLKEKLKQH